MGVKRAHSICVGAHWGETQDFLFANKWIEWHVKTSTKHFLRHIKKNPAFGFCVKSNPFLASLFPLPAALKKCSSLPGSSDTLCSACLWCLLYDWSTHSNKQRSVSPASRRRADSSARWGRPSAEEFPPQRALITGLHPTRGGTYLQRNTWTLKHLNENYKHGCRGEYDLVLMKSTGPALQAALFYLLEPVLVLNVSCFIMGCSLGLW